MWKDRRKGRMILADRSEEREYTLAFLDEHGKI